MMFITAHASNRSGAAGNSQNRRGSGTNYARGTDQKRNGPESMGDYYRRTGQSALGATARTRGNLTSINAVTRGR